jgi:hypothetical protein
MANLIHLIFKYAIIKEDLKKYSSRANYWVDLNQILVEGPWWEIIHPHYSNFCKFYPGPRCLGYCGHVISLVRIKKEWHFTPISCARVGFSKIATVGVNLSHQGPPSEIFLKIAPVICPGGGGIGA